MIWHIRQFTLCYRKTARLLWQWSTETEDTLCLLNLKCKVRVDVCTCLYISLDEYISLIITVDTVLTLWITDCLITRTPGLCTEATHSSSSLTRNQRWLRDCRCCCSSSSPSVPCWTPSTAPSSTVSWWCLGCCACAPGPEPSPGPGDSWWSLWCSLKHEINHITIKKP